MGFPMMQHEIEDSPLTAKLEKDIEKIIAKPVRVHIGPTPNYETEGYCFVIQLRNPTYLQLADGKYFPVHDSVAKFSLGILNNTESVVVSYNSIVIEKYQNLGLGSLLHEYRLNLLKSARSPYTELPWFHSIICTVNLNNEHEIKILKKFGWKPILPSRPYGKIEHLGETIWRPSNELWGKLLWED